MLKKTITYTNFDGETVSEDFYFNLTKAEIAEMELAHQGGFSEHLQRIVEQKDAGQIILTFKKIIMDSVGRRSEDGKRFVKSPEITAEFLETNAYSELFMEIVTDAEAGANFINGVIPQDMVEEFNKLQAVTDVELPEGQAKDDRPAYIRENREPTKAEIQKMSKEELLVAMSRKHLPKPK